MNKKPYFLRCNHCGNIVGMINDKGVPLMCCGEKMKILEPNTIDAAVEKHIPVLEKHGDVLKVSVGKVSHPMTEEHSIEWICVMSENKVYRVRLDPSMQPKAEFCGIGDEYEVYAYCNLHGLWSAKL